MGSRNNKPGRIVKGTAKQPTLKDASGIWSLDEAMQAHRANAWPQPNLFQPVSNSLRLDGSRNTFLSKAISRSGNQRTWTWSGWFKPSTTGDSQYLFVSTNTNGNPFTYVYFSDSNFIWWDGTQRLVTTAKYRDTSAWYHVVLAVDTTQATAANRGKLYINGVQVTSFSLANYPAQGAATYTNSNAPGENVAYISAPPGYVYGYLAEVNFVDGYQLDPSLLGKFDTNNTWVPVAYTGTYGTNGFYLPFTNTTTSQTLGYDASFNGTTTYDADQDPYRGSVALHLTGNGPAGGNNNVFADSSPNNFAITRNGDATQGSFSPFPMPANAPYNPAINGASAYFDGTGDFLTVPANSAFNLGTGDFTIEFWAYLNPYVAFGGSASYWAEIIGINVGVSDSNSVTNTLGIWQGDGTGSSTVAGEYTVIISGSSTNQQRLHSGITSYNRWSHVALTRSSGTFTLWQDGVSRATASLSADISRNDYVRIGRSINSGIQGSISNIRVIKGTAVYTSAFTPTNKPFGTLTNNLITFSENFTSAWWANNTSNTEGTAIAPDGTPSATTLATGTYPAAAGVGSSTVAVTGSIYAKANVGNQLTFRLNRWGSGADYVEVIFNLTTGTATGATTAGTASGLATSIVNVGNGWWRCVISGTTSTTGGAISFNPNPTSGSIFIWGAQLETGGTATNYTPTPANFSTAPSLLLNFANAAVVDSAGANNITTVSGATITSSSKYGSGAMTFNGSTDHLTTPTNACFTYGTGDFTIEMWVYITANPGSYAYIYAQSANNTTSMSLYIQDGRFKIWNGTNVISGSTLYSLNTWYHVAISRSGTSLRLFLNGVQDGAASNNSSITTGSSFGANIGRWAEIGDGGYFNGSIDDLRVTKGLARYTSAFTPPARALPETGGDSFVTANVNAGVVQRFTTTGTTSWTAPVDVTSVEVLVVAGGGGGANYNSAGGGGAGGLIYNNAYPVTPGQTYTVTVGAGGVGGGVLGNPASDALAAATSGGNSVFGALVAIGGGNGGQGNVQGSRTGDVSPGTGGSGGGARAASAPANAGAAGTAGQGFAGGNSGTYTGPNYPGGGGGGAGGPGGPGVDATTGGNGGVGLQFGISGTTAYYAGGGGGSTQGSGTTTSGGLGGGGAGGGGSGGAFATGVSGTANTGGGGGAGGYNGTTGSGGAGGSGIVIVRYTTTAVGNSSDATTDNLVDSPTQYGHDSGLGGEVVGNYCTWSPLVVVNYGDGVSYKSTLSNGNLTATYGTNFSWAYGSIGIPNNAKTYIEYTVNSYTSTGNGWIGFSDVASIGVYFGVTVNGSVYIGNGSYNVNDSPGFATGDILGFAVDRIGNTLTLYKNGSQVYNVALAYGITSSTVLLPAVWTRAPGDRVTLNAGQRPWAYAPPAGFTALTTKNFARLTAGTPAANPNQYFDTVTYTGTGATQSITGLNFQPDFVWIKNRSTASYGHKLYDVIRGVYNQLETNDTGAETAGASNSFASFNSNGFTLGPYAGTNGSTNNLVAWCWKAGGAAVSNTSGTITSQVSANTTSGFSVVTYTGNGTAGATVGHGLGVAPNLIIWKKRSSTSNWFVWSKAMDVVTGVTGWLYLNATNSQQTSGSTNEYPTYKVDPTSTLITLNGTGSSNGVNDSSATYVAYCWTEIPGFSKFGTYTGNGSSTDGPFIYTGFKPAFYMAKCTSTTSNAWIMYDNKRSTYNLNGQKLGANVADEENNVGNLGDSTTGVDFLSNGIKIRSAGSNNNTSAATYIYMAFAEAPFGNVNGVAR